jgi:hypothetical protein
MQFEQLIEIRLAISLNYSAVCGNANLLTKFYFEKEWNTIKNKIGSREKEKSIYSYSNLFL